MKQQIAASLEQAFSQYGFAEPSVAQLKTACNVSLRTLYKHYPSKEAMIVGALEYRHQRYLSLLLTESNDDHSPAQSLMYIFSQLEKWMQEFAPHGCLSMNAIAAFPDNPKIKAAVEKHKQDVRQILARQGQRDDLATALFLLHEGVSSTWPLLGKEAVNSAHKVLLQLLKEDV